MFLLMVLRVGDILELQGAPQLISYVFPAEKKIFWKHDSQRSTTQPSRQLQRAASDSVQRNIFHSVSMETETQNSDPTPKLLKCPPLSVVLSPFVRRRLISSPCNMGTLTSQYVANHNNDYRGAGRDWVWKNYLTRNNKRFKAEEAERAVTGWTADIRREGVPGPCQETQTSGRHKTKGHMECTMKAEFTLNDIMSTAKENT